MNRNRWTAAPWWAALGAPLLALLLLAGGSTVAQTPAPAAPENGAPTAAAPTPERNREISRIRGERGLDVCRVSADGLHRYQGITQGYERGKVQILVHVVDAKTGEATPGVRDTNVWDDPANWSICTP
jgi:hypothetical protein